MVLGENRAVFFEAVSVSDVAILTFPEMYELWKLVWNLVAPVAAMYW